MYSTILDTALRQGDIVDGIFLLGAIKLSAIHVTNNQQGEAVSWTIPAKPKLGQVMVLSHSCEIAKENNVKLTSIILAPIRGADTATSKDKLKELIESNVLTNQTEMSYLKYFYLTPHEKLTCSKGEYGGVVDFSKSFSVHKSALESLEKNKVLQLTDSTVAAMALKCAVYYHREAA